MAVGRGVGLHHFCGGVLVGFSGERHRVERWSHSATFGGRLTFLKIVNE